MPLVSSPAATGSAGTFFEQHVNAYWLAQLLVEAIPPILHDCSVVEVHLQTEVLGWHTDDFLIVGESSPGQKRKLAGQVKRSFTVSATDEECKKAFQDFWADFKDPGHFNPATDRFALVTLRGTNTLLEYFAGLLDAARAARDAEEFKRRLATKGFLNAQSIKYANEIRTIVGAMERRSVSVGELWPFLRVLHVLSLDLNTATQQTEASMKTLLAHTSGGADAIAAATDSWNALLREAGDGMPTARRFRLEDLPESLRKRHAVVGGAGQQALRALRHHSSLILDGIRSTVGAGLHLARAGIVQQVIQEVAASQIVLVSGAAGSGKSSVAKDVAKSFAADHFVFAFRAEEFATPHFDETLSRSQVPASAALLSAILASQGRKVMFVESVERLLEASTRDAFNDLLTLVTKDPTWRVVLTCRDYSTELVRAAFLSGAADGSVVRVPPLDDDELQAVEAANPSLARPLSNATLRRLLRNPYVLDKALQVSWPAEDSLPQSEREFRRRVWRDIVRADHHSAAGMPQRRESTFVQVALRRARALTLYAPCTDLDAEAIGALRRDSLVVSSEGAAGLLAPAHDVLEDWAILQWIDEQHIVADGSVSALSCAIGTHPAVRRTYRKWVAELVDRDKDAADQLFRAVIQDADLSAQFRDDTIISVLRSSSAPAFLERHASDLLADDKRLLRLMIRLLRVGCVVSPSWLEGVGAAPSVLSAPEGPAWACVLHLVASALASFKPVECGLLLGFVEDWARGVSRETPYPDGADAAIAIAHWLLPSFDDYRSDDQRKRTLKVIAKLPLADRERFSALLQGDRNGDDRDRSSEDFQEMVFGGIDGMPAGRDVADDVIAAARSYLLRTDDDDDPYGRSGIDLEPLFGIKDGLRHDFFPASAYRGPFLTLMMHHPQKALEFIIGVFNHSADWYAHPRGWSRSSIEEPFEVTLTFADGTSKTQWCNERLWGWYRGMSVGPYALQSLLMAMEHGLLELAKACPGEMDALLLDTLRKSDSAAITAVIASVATAHPRVCGETLLVLLGCQTYIQVDRSRFSSESHPPSKMNGMFPSHGEAKIYEHERMTADARPHRKRDLELAVLNLQLGPLAARVQEVLDRHRAALPTPEKQSEGDRVWRLALHRMDARRYKATEHAAPELSADGVSAPSAKPGFVRLDLDVPESDVKKMVDEAAAHLEDMNARSTLYMWATKVFDREPGDYDPAQWKQRLDEAIAAATREPDGEFDWGRGGPGLVAAVCVRDHWDEMTPDHRDWCVDTVCSEVEKSDQWNQMARVQRNLMSADRACATVIPVLAGKHLDESRSDRARKGLVLALTHAVDEVRAHAAAGIGWHLWPIDRDLALKCVRALAAEAMLVEQAVDAERSRPRKPRAPFEKPSDEESRSIDEIKAEAASSIRVQFFLDGGIAEDADKNLDPTASFGAEANARILSILQAAPGESAATDAFERLARTLVAWWDSDDDRRSSHQGRERKFVTESAQARLLQRFVLQTSVAAAAKILQPILNAVERHPKETGRILDGLIYANDSNPNNAQFWSLWSLFAERVRVAKWLPAIDGEYGQGKELISALFLGIHWKDGVRHWGGLEGHARQVHDLFDALAPSPTVLEKYLGLLYHVGEQSLPEAFIRVAARLKSGEPQYLLSKANSVYLLEVLLQRYVYARPLELKKRKDLREAVLFLLDQLVEAGSSAAFRMRDDFVTPVSTP
ncbi:AAA family ATPase [Sorangium cellulosum]|uniref:AAA family ATPase n=1 Tax=Sorangium cellulosum TaxID=56 RepID=A0A150S7R9_SORCE|nr:AAA family ATPase [Sorangium cellulosum]